MSENQQFPSHVSVRCYENSNEHSIIKIDKIVFSFKKSDRKLKEL